MRRLGCRKTWSRGEEEEDKIGTLESIYVTFFAWNTDGRRGLGSRDILQNLTNQGKGSTCKHLHGMNLQQHVGTLHLT